MEDFLTFRRMITPILIQIVYWIATVAVILAGLAGLIGGFGDIGRIGGFFLLILGPIGVRIYAELLMLMFRMNETLTEIKNNTERTRSS